MPPSLPIKIGDSLMKPDISVKNLGVFFHTSLSMHTHITHLCKLAYFHLFNISSIRQYITKDVTKMIVHSLVLSRLDYASSLLFYVPEKPLPKLQRIQNVADRIITHIRSNEQITPALESLHWLLIKARIEYKILVIVFKILHGKAPEYLSEMLTSYVSNRPLRSSKDNKLKVSKSKTVTYGD